MGKLLSLLKSVDRSIRGRMGYWMQAVSKEVDALVNSKFVETKFIDAVQSVGDLATGEVALFDTILSQNGVSYDPATGGFSLDANSTYELEAHLQFENFGTVATDIARWRWIDTDGNTLPPGHRVEGKAYPPASTENISGISCAKATFKTTTVLVAQVLVTGGTGSADISLGSYAIVRKIG